MERIGRGLIEERTARVMAELAEVESKGVERTAIEGDKTMLGRDLLSVISTLQQLSSTGNTTLTAASCSPCKLVLIADSAAQ